MADPDPDSEKNSDPDPEEKTRIRNTVTYKVRFDTRTWLFFFCLSKRGSQSRLKMTAPAPTNKKSASAPPLNGGSATLQATIKNHKDMINNIFFLN